MIHRLTYWDKLPKRNHRGNHWSENDFKKKLLKLWGELPTPMRCGPEKRQVRFIRVLGKGEREMDRDNLAFALKGAQDALRRGGYIYQDSPKWLEVSYEQDGTRRELGPRLEVIVMEMEPF